MSGETSPQHHTRPQILVVDDARESLRLLTDLLSSAGYRVRPTVDPNRALQAALASPPDLALLDVCMPGLDGFALCRLLKENPRTAQIPILFISALQDMNKHLHGFEIGGVDFITKPIEKRLALARIETHLRLAQTQRELEKQRNQLEQRVRERTRDLQAELLRRRKQEAQLRKSEAERRLAASVFEHTTQGVIITDTDAKIIAVNRAFTVLSGYSKAEVLGQNPSLWRIDEDDDAFERAIQYALKGCGHWQGEVQNRRKDGETYPAWLTVNSVYDDEGQRTHFIALYSDISAIKESQERLRFLAHHDSLSRLPNRMLFTARLEHAITSAKRRHFQLAVLAIDLDNFKQINDGLGHHVGDQVLQQVAARLSGRVRKSDTVARMGGDEFAILMEDAHGSHSASVLAEKLLAAFEDPIQVEEHRLYISLSLGICLYPKDGEDVATLLKHADSALYRAKEEGRNRYSFYTRDLTEEALTRLQMENDLHSALKHRELSLHYQPQFSLVDERLICVEALVRWNHPQRGCLLPNQFISLAETNGLIIPIGNWVLEQACLQGQAWREAGLEIGRIAVNVAGQQLRTGTFLQVVEQALDKSGLDPRYLELEITECFIMRQAELAIQVLHRLHELGITITIDDFGTGYSSLSSLGRLPIDKLKVDRSFSLAIHRDADAKTIAQAVVVLGKSLNLYTVAEGVEERAQRDFFLQVGCDAAQGFLYSHPLPAQEFAAFLSTVSRTSRYRKQRCHETLAIASGSFPGNAGDPSTG